MLRPGVRLRTIRIVVVSGALLFSAVASSWAAASEEEICNGSADFALGLEDYPTAIVLHLKLLRAHKNDALAHYHLGFAYAMTGRTTEEISEYLEAAKLGLDQWDLFLNLGLAYLARNEPLKAINALQTAVLLGADHPEAHFNLAIAYESVNRLSEALNEITASLRMAPEDPDERNMKALICAESGDLGCARAEWHHVLQVAPEYAPARTNLTLLDELPLSLLVPSGTELNGLAFDRLNREVLPAPLVPEGNLNREELRAHSPRESNEATDIDMVQPHDQELRRIARRRAD